LLASAEDITRSRLDFANRKSGTGKDPDSEFASRHKTLDHDLIVIAGSNGDCGGPTSAAR
jgi:hypothetical protein